MQSILLHPNENIAPVAEILQSGGLVVFPTETVYGLGANALNEEAVKKIFTAKGRPQDNPLIVHIADLEAIKSVVDEIPEKAVRLFERFSPGPLTLVLKKSKDLPSVVTAGLESVAVRIPAHPRALEFLSAVNLPVAAPSANRSGRPSPTTFEMAVSEMKGRADAIIDGGDCRLGLESTVLKVDEKGLTLLRPGSISREEISDFSGERVWTRGENSKKIESPGMKYRHYRPKAEVFFTEKFDVMQIAKRFENKKMGVLCLSPAPPVFILPDLVEVLSFESVEDYAASLYKSFFDFDQKGADIILAQSVPETGLGLALMNRIKKAGTPL